MTHEQIEAIRERAEKATEGPWRSVALVSGSTSYVILTDGDAITANIVADEIKGVCSARFIANAREDIPALLAEVERLQKQNEEYERALSQIAHGDTHVAYPHDIAAWALGWELNGKTIKEESE